MDNSRVLMHILHQKLAITAEYTVSGMQIYVSIPELRYEVCYSHSCELFYSRDAGTW